MFHRKSEYLVEDTWGNIDVDLNQWSRRIALGFLRRTVSSFRLVVSRLFLFFRSVTLLRRFLVILWWSLFISLLVAFTLGTFTCSFLMRLVLSWFLRRIFSRFISWCFNGFFVYFFRLRIDLPS
uniref:Uncharacterized protein n=1 Tax=Anopheles atroparvus TaxID=41427 RepID=A0A182IVB2_ANOAO